MEGEEPSDDGGGGEADLIPLVSGELLGGPESLDDAGDSGEDPVKVEVGFSSKEGMDDLSDEGARHRPDRARQHRLGLRPQLVQGLEQLRRSGGQRRPGGCFQR